MSIKNPENENIPNDLMSKVSLLQAENKTLRQINKIASDSLNLYSQMICFCNSNLIIEYANNSYIKAFAKNGDTLAGKSVESGLGPEHFKRIKSNIDLVLNGETVKHFEVVKAKDGKNAILEVQLIPELSSKNSENIEGFWEILTNIENVESNPFAKIGKGIFEPLMPDEFWATDLQLNLIYVNQKTENIFGFTVEERLKQSYLEVLTPESAKHAETILTRELNKLKTTGKADTPIIAELKSYHKKGYSVWVEIKADFLFDSSNNLIGVYGITRDIAERKKAEKELNKSQSRYYDIFQATGTATIIYESDDSISLANNECYRVTGYPPEELLGRKWTEFVAPESINLMKENQKLRRDPNHDIPHKYEVKLVNKKGEKRDAIISIGLIEKSNQTVVSIYDITEHKKILEENLQVTQKYKELYENVTVGIYRTTVDGKIQLANPVLLRMLGFDSLKELQKRNLEISGFTDKDERKRFKKYLEENGKIKEHESSWITKNGRVIHVKESARAVKNEKGEIIYYEGTVENITDKKTAEHERENERLLLRTIIDNIPHAIYMKDLDLRKVIVNPTELESMGISSEAEAIGKNDFDIYPKEQAEGFEKHDKKVIQSGQAELNIEERLILKSGEEKWISTSKIPFLDANGVVKGIIGIGIDVTERVNSQKMIQLREKALHSAANGIIITDINGVTQWVNTGFTKISGYTKEEALGKNPGTLVKSGKHTNEFYAELWETILSGNVWKGELINKRKNGELYHEEETISPVFDNSGKITHFIGIKSDITERKAMEHDLIVSRQKAEESDKLKSAFLMNLSHEIRTPLNAIFGFSEIIRDTLQDETLKDMANMVLQSSNRLLNTVNDIMEISVIQTKQIKIQKKRFDVHALTQLIFDYYKVMYAGNLNVVNFNLILPGHVESVIVDADEEKLKQSLNKIIDNAFKFTKSGKIDLGYLIEDKRIKLFIRDTGPGIKPEMQKQIFEYFRQGDDSLSRGYEGLGVGLAIAKGLLNELGISLELKSEVGKGSEFFMYIPIEEMEIKKDKAQQPVKPAIPDFSNKTILIVEDDQASQVYLRKVIERAKARVLTAENGFVAIEKVKSNEIDLILMDIRMPVMNGIEATMEIKSMYPHLPIIAQTAFAMIQDQNEALEAGCDVVVTKPVNKNELYQRIGELIFRS